MATIKGNSRANKLAGTDAADVIFGLGGDDRLAGGAGEDVLYGDDDSLTDTFGSGGDRLDGGIGDDLLIGGAGADALHGGAGDDILIGGLASGGVAGSPYVLSGLDGGNDTYYGAAGFDLAILTFDRAGAIAFDLSLGSGSITENGVSIGAIGGIEAVIAFLGGGGDAVAGASAGDELHGRGGDDVLSGGGGGDRIDGGAGDDRLSGGEGFDTLSYLDATAGVTVDLSLAGQAQDTLGAGIDTIDGFEQVDGSNFSDRLIGSAGDDYMTAGNAGGDRLFGGDGDDHLAIARLATDAPKASTLNGGVGDDVLTVVAQAGAVDAIAVIGGGGADTAYLTVAARQTISMGTGEDRVVLSAGTGEVAITLGHGVDTVAFDGAAGVPEGQVAAHVGDFAAGENGDRIDLRDLLADAAIGYGGGNPFAAGFLRLTASDTGTALQFDADGAAAGHTFVTILELDGAAPTEFTAFNFGGTDPDGAAPPAALHQLAWPASAALV